MSGCRSYSPSCTTFIEMLCLIRQIRKSQTQESDAHPGSAGARQSFAFSPQPWSKVTSGTRQIIRWSRLLLVAQRASAAPVWPLCGHVHVCLGHFWRLPLLEGDEQKPVPDVLRPLRTPQAGGIGALAASAPSPTCPFMANSGWNSAWVAAWCWCKVCSTSSRRRNSSPTSISALLLT